jgi:hypothetical protein
VFKKALRVVSSVVKKNAVCSRALQGRLRRNKDPVQSREQLAGSSERELAKKGPELVKMKNLHC